MNTKSILAICFLLTLALSSQGQTPQNKTIKQIDLLIENGYMLPAPKDLSNILVNASYYNGLTARLGWQTESPYVYSQIYNNPVYGIGWYSSTFHNDSIGKPNALFGFAKVPWYRGDKWSFNYGLAFGLSYNFEPFSPESNAFNYMIGSYKNAYIDLSMEAQRQFGKRFLLSAGVGFKHFSNGSSSQPNSGINLIPFIIKGTYVLDKREPDFSKTTPIPTFIKNNHISFVWGPGVKQYAHGEPRYFVSTFGLRYMRQAGYKARWGGGFDLFYKGSGPDKVMTGESNFQKTMSYAVYAGYDWVLTERLYITVDFGIYFKRHSDNDEVTPYYERVSPRYKITKNLFTGIGIKAHKGGADYIEWTVGYTLNQDGNKYR